MLNLKAGEAALGDTLKLGRSRDYRHDTKSLHNICGYVDKQMSSGLTFSTIARLVAVLHCGTNNTIVLDDLDVVRHINGSIVGWRRGTYAVLLRLLFMMGSEISLSLIGFRCVDSSIGNIPVHKDGSVTSDKHACRRLRQREVVSDTLNHVDCEPELTQAQQTGFVTVSAPGPPKVPICLSIERPYFTDEPHLSLCGRANGEIIDTVGIPPILHALARSLRCK